MSDEAIEVTRADREAALRALGCDDYSVPQFRAWLDTGESRWRVHFGVELVEAASVAATIARVRIAAERAGYERGVREERERCLCWMRAVRHGDIEPRDGYRAIEGGDEPEEAGEQAKEGA